jgi:hypothetical protein
MRYLIGACCLALAAAGCGGGGKSAATTTTTPSTTSTTSTTGTTVTVTGKHHYSKQVVNSFIRSCTKGDPAKLGYCGCVIDKLSENVSTRDFARIARTGKATARVARAIRLSTAACATSG